MHGLDFAEYSLPSSIPVVVTLHLPLSWYRPGAWSRFETTACFCCVSESQRSSRPPALEHALVIENGVPIPTPPRKRQRGDFAVVLGRICAEKNAHAALEAGNLAGVPVLLGGQVYPYREHQEYFAEKLSPLLRPQTGGVIHRFLGPLSTRERQELLSTARCLLHPTLAPETSSLVAMEALAVGTPVIAYPSGALPYIVEHGVTGFLVGNVEEMAKAIGEVGIISSEQCREAARRRFGSDRMIRHYLELYRALAERPFIAGKIA